MRQAIAGLFKRASAEGIDAIADAPAPLRRILRALRNGSGLARAASLVEQASICSSDGAHRGLCACATSR